LCRAIACDDALELEEPLGSGAEGTQRW
jgi:hypothetical protein